MENNNIHSSHEYKRVRELLRYNILDTPDEQEFDDLTNPWQDFAHCRS